MLTVLELLKPFVEVSAAFNTAEASLIDIM